MPVIIQAEQEAPLPWEPRARQLATP